MIDTNGEEGGEGPPIEYVPVDSLHFDPDNPRLPPSVDSEDEGAVIRWMLRDATVIELMSSIGESGYFEGEPVLVVDREGEEEQYSVVEGNRRLAAVKLLRNPALAPVRQRTVAQTAEDANVRPEELPVIRYESRDELLNYLGYRHVTGIKEWDPKAKARHLDLLRTGLEEEDPKEEQKQLARTIGSRSDYVGRLLTGLEIYRDIVDSEFFGIAEDEEEDPINFSVLTTALSYENIYSFLGLESNRDPSLDGLNEERLADLTRWMFEEGDDGRTRLGESRNLNQLSKVVADENALKAFGRGTSLQEAYNMTGGPREAFRDSINAALKELKVARDNLHLVDHPSSGDSDTLEEVLRIARLLKNQVETQLMELEEFEEAEPAASPDE